MNSNKLLFRKVLLWWCLFLFAERKWPFYPKGPVASLYHAFYSVKFSTKDRSSGTEMLLMTLSEGHYGRCHYGHKPILHTMGRHFSFLSPIICSRTVLKTTYKDNLITIYIAVLHSQKKCVTSQHSSSTLT